MTAATALLAAIALSLPLSAQAPRADEPDALRCVNWWREVRYSGAGYDHWVQLESACAVQAICSVVTDVNPDVISVAVAPGEHVAVLTWRGSPAYEFSAGVECQKAPGD